MRAGVRVLVCFVIAFAFQAFIIYNIFINNILVSYCSRVSINSNDKRRIAKKIGLYCFLSFQSFQHFNAF